MSEVRSNKFQSRTEAFSKSEVYVHHDDHHGGYAVLATKAASPSSGTEARTGAAEEEACHLT